MLYRENHWPVTSHWQTLSYNVVSRTAQHEQGSNSQLLVLIVTDCTGSCKSTYDAITTTTAPLWITGILVVLSKPNIQLVLETKNKWVSGCHVACTLKQLTIQFLRSSSIYQNISNDCNSYYFSSCREVLATLITIPMSYHVLRGTKSVIPNNPRPYSKPLLNPKPGSSLAYRYVPLVLFIKHKFKTYIYLILF